MITPPLAHWRSPPHSHSGLLCRCTSSPAPCVYTRACVFIVCVLCSGTVALLWDRMDWVRTDQNYWAKQEKKRRIRKSAQSDWADLRLFSHPVLWLLGLFKHPVLLSFIWSRIMELLPGIYALTLALLLGYTQCAREQIPTGKKVMLLTVHCCIQSPECPGAFMEFSWTCPTGSSSSEPRFVCPHSKRQYVLGVFDRKKVRGTLSSRYLHLIEM